MATDSAPIHLRDSADLVAPRGHYSHVAIHGTVAYLSGQLPVDSAGNSLADRSLAEQTRQVLENLDSSLAAAGSSRSRLLQVTVYITDIDMWPEFDGLYAQWIGEHRPSRAVAGVDQLHYGAAVEIQAVAAL